MVFKLFRKPPLPHPLAPLRDYWVKVRVALYEPRPPEGNDPDDLPAVGFLRLFGIRADPLALRGMIESEVFEEGTIDWADSTTEEIDLASLEKVVRERIIPIEGAGVWYRSGHLYFADEE